MDRGPGSRRGVLELVALTVLCLVLHVPAFLREPFKIIELSTTCQAQSHLRLMPIQLPDGGNFFPCEFRPALKGKVPLNLSRSAKYQRSTGKTSPEPLGLTGDQLLGRAMACSLRDSQQGFRGAFPPPHDGFLPTSPDPANQLPTSHIGQATWPPGGSTAHLQPLKSSIGYPAMQALTLRSARTANPSTATC